MSDSLEYTFNNQRQSLIGYLLLEFTTHMMARWNWTETYTGWSVFITKQTAIG